jgi:hypothetical protein
VLNFTDRNLTSSRTTEPTQEHRAEVPVVQERVTVTPLPAPAPQPETAPGIPSFHVPPLASSLDWEQLRDYVVERIQAVHGPIPPEPQAGENTIFMGFYGRWEDLALPIARSTPSRRPRGSGSARRWASPASRRSSDAVFATKIAAQL